MSRTYYLQLIFALVVLLQGCRPTTNDQTGFSTPDSGDSSQSGQHAQSNTDQVAEPSDTSSGALGDTSNIPMQGEMGSSGDFMIAAAETGLTEVKLAELALERSTTPKVKEFAQMMLKDHNEANAELRKLAQKKNVQLPSSLCLECEAKYNALSKREGADFDSTYMQLMVKDHKSVLEKFVFQSSRGGDQDVKEWASKKVPDLQHHLNTAQKWQQPGNAAASNPGSR